MKKYSVLITGASRGIGKALALEWAKRGAELIVTCKEREKDLVKTLEELEEFGIKTYGFVGDLSQSYFTQALKEEIDFAVATKRLSMQPNVIINNAGVSYIGLIQEMDDNDWNKVVGTNLTAPFNIVRNFVPYMIKNQDGVIANVSSMWGKCGASCEVAYSASKAGLEGFSKALALELEPSKVDSIAFRLGMIDTEMNKHFTKEDMEEIADELVDGKIGNPGDVASFIVDAIINKKYLTGQVVDVPFGWFKECK